MRLDTSLNFWNNNYKKIKKMKSLLKIVFISIVASFIWSCSQDDDITEPNGGGGSNGGGEPNPVILNSTNFMNDVDISEDASSQVIRIQFSEIATGNASLKVRLNPTALENIEIDLDVVNNVISVPIVEGRNFSEFNITPLDNLIVNENSIVTFEIIELPLNYILGNKASLTLTIIDNEEYITTNFIDNTSITLIEGSDNYLKVILGLSNPVQESGTIKLRTIYNQPSELISSAEFNDFNEVEIQLLSGQDEAYFELFISDDQLLLGHIEVVFEIIETYGLVIIGDQNEYKLVLLDDELRNKPKSIESFSGNWIIKKTYEYNELGQISKINWERNTPNYTSGVKTYYYDSNGFVNRVNNYPNNDEYFYFSNRRVYRSDEIDFGITKSYKLYDYDSNNRVVGISKYDRQPNGSYINTMIFVYLYHNSGNIYKQLTYINNSNINQFELVSTRSYSNYFNSDNPFYSLEILPNYQPQLQLPADYNVFENGVNMDFSFSYEFSANGFPTRRISSGTGSSEIVNYEYY